MKKLLASASAAALALALVTGLASAFSSGGGNSANAPGQANAIANCTDVILKQNANGQTGSNTGSGNDSKQLNTAVTNCDHFWN